MALERYTVAISGKDKISVRIYKEPGRYKYAVVLGTMYKGKSVIVREYDNFHGKGNHVHICHRKKKPYVKKHDFKGVKEIINHLQDNYKKYIEDYLRKR